MRSMILTLCALLMVEPLAEAAPVDTERSVFGSGGATVALLPDTVPLPDGPYASRQIMTSSTKPGPRLGRIRVRTVALALHRVRREADSILVSTRFCDVRQDRIGPAGTILDSAFIAALPTWESTALIEGTGPWLFRTSEFVAVVGADVDDPASDPLPGDPEDPRVTDPDGDGEPGLTVRVEGVVSGGVFIVQRIIRSLEGTITSDGRISGTVIGGNQQSKLGASNFILRAFTPTFVPDEDPEHNPFTWVPLETGDDCAKVVASEELLFGTLE